MRYFLGFSFATYLLLQCDALSCQVETHQRVCEGAHAFAPEEGDGGHALTIYLELLRTLRNYSLGGIALRATCAADFLNLSSVTLNHLEPLPITRLYDPTGRIKYNIVD